MTFIRYCAALVAFAFLALLLYAQPVRSEGPCISADRVVLDVGAFVAAGRGTMDYYDDEQAAAWIAAYNAEPPESYSVGHAVLVFTQAHNGMNPHAQRPLRAGSVVAYLFDERGCLAEIVGAGPDAAKRIDEAAFGKPA